MTSRFYIYYDIALAIVGSISNGVYLFKSDVLEKKTLRADIAIIEYISKVTLSVCVMAINISKPDDWNFATFLLMSSSFLPTAGSLNSLIVILIDTTRLIFAFQIDSAMGSSGCLFSILMLWASSIISFIVCGWFISYVGIVITFVSIPILTLILKLRSIRKCFYTKEYWTLDKQRKILLGVIADLMYLGYFTLSLSRVLEDALEDVPVSNSPKMYPGKTISDHFLNIFWQLALSFLVLPRPSILLRDSTRNEGRRRTNNDELPGLVDILFS